MNSRERIFALFAGKPVDRLACMPITMQLAADLVGRKYYDYVTDYRVLVEGQLKVAEQYGFDQLGTLSDPAREAADCGAAIKYFEDSPPAIDESNALLADKTKLAKLKIPDAAGGGGRMHDRVKAVELYKSRVGNDKIIEGWVEGPCAEGADLRGINTIMTDFFDDPGFIKDLFEFAINMALNFAKAQIEAGADTIGIGDAAASLVGPKIYEEFIWPYEKRLIDGIHKMGGAIRLHICGNTRALLEGMGRLGAEMIDLDFPSPVRLAREKMGPKQVICGNINPVAVLRDQTPEEIYQAIENCHKEAGDKYIVGAGCEITRDTPQENIRTLARYAASH
jgi:MtaA/CmuA family methyltransferase